MRKRLLPQPIPIRPLQEHRPYLTWRAIRHPSYHASPLAGAGWSADVLKTVVMIQYIIADYYLERIPLR